jgi:hypothetical protein
MPPSSADHGTNQAARATDDHPTSENACRLGSHIGKNYRKECARKRVEQYRWKQQRDCGHGPLVAIEPGALANTPNQDRHYRETSGKQYDDAKPRVSRQNSLASESKQSCRKRPEYETQQNESKLHKMNLSSSSHKSTPL